jgi:thiol-disulfide isomerase/thioredoxin
MPVDFAGMKKVILLILINLPMWMHLFGQNYMVQGTIEDAEEGQIYLASYYADRFRIVDSIESASGFFYFMFSGDEPPGIYRIIYSDRINGVLTENRFVEFIYNRENIELAVPNNGREPEPHFSNTVENVVYNEFMDFELNYESRLMSVYQQLYPADSSERCLNAAMLYDTLQVKRNRFMDSLSARYPGLYATRIMNAFRSPFTPGSLSHQERIDTLKTSFFNYAGIDDPLLLYAPVYTFKVVDYLSLYKVDTFSVQEQQEAFIEAVDGIMEHVSADPEIQAFVVNFLLEGFQLLGMGQVQLYLAENYLAESCESDLAELVRLRMEGYERMTPGKLAPDFVIRDVEGKSHQLSRMEHPYVAVLFWASSCEHCRELLPELNEWYLRENHLGIEVVAISIDESAADFQRYVDELDPAWITARDPLGWTGKVAGDYFVYSTPSLFLVDYDRIIVARPGNFKQFLRAVRKLEGE